MLFIYHVKTGRCSRSESDFNDRIAQNIHYYRAHNFWNVLYKNVFYPRKKSRKEFACHTNSQLLDSIAVTS